MMRRSNRMAPANSQEAYESLRTQADNVGCEAWNDWRNSLELVHPTWQYEPLTSRGPN
jgi:hypothetical protein